MHPSCGPTHLPGRQQSRQEVVLEAALQLEQFGLLGEGAEESGVWKGGGGWVAVVGPLFRHGHSLGPAES